MNRFYARQAVFADRTYACGDHAGLVTSLGEIPCAKARKHRRAFHCLVATYVEPTPWQGFHCATPVNKMLFLPYVNSCPEHADQCPEA